MSGGRTVKEEGQGPEAPGPMAGLAIIAGARLPRNLKHALSVIHRYTQRWEGCARASQETYAADCGVSVRHWRRMEGTLFTRRLVRRDKRPGRPSILSIDFGLLKTLPQQRERRKTASNAPLLSVLSCGKLGDTLSPRTSAEVTSDICGGTPGHLEHEPRTPVSGEVSKGERQVKTPSTEIDSTLDANAAAKALLSEKLGAASQTMSDEELGAMREKWREVISAKATPAKGMSTEEEHARRLLLKKQAEEVLRRFPPATPAAERK